MRISKTVERWFEVPEDSDEAELKIKHLTPGEEANVFDEAFKQEIKYKKKGKDYTPTVIQKTNPHLIVKLNNIAAIVGWKNFFDENDKPIECNEDNKMSAYDKIEGFGDLISELRGKLSDEISQEKEDQRKNSQSSASGPAK